MILVGLAILWSARGAGEVDAEVLRWQAARTRSSRLRRAALFQARFAPAATVWYGRVVAALAIVGGMVILVGGWR